MSLLSSILRTGDGHARRSIERLVPTVSAWEPAVRELADEDFAARTAQWRAELERLGPPGSPERLDHLHGLLPEAYALVREASRRVFGKRHHDVQVMGGIVLHTGRIAQMRTGEGKTLVATLAAYLNALDGRGVHVVTANEYLAARDATTMGQLYRFLGLSTGVTLVGHDVLAKKVAYSCDITYGTATEFGFDYLRDNMAMRAVDRVQRGHAFALVDEVDSILIDEARTPLIISGPTTSRSDMYIRFAALVAGFEPDVHYVVNEAMFQVAPTEAGIAVIEDALEVSNLYDPAHHELAHHLNCALVAHALYRRDHDYVVQFGMVLIVDKATQRAQLGRRWSNGIHQAVEAKEGVEVTEENVTVATVTLQKYFALYDKLAGMTGTAATDAGEFGSVYGLEVVDVPTNVPPRRTDHPDVIYGSEDAKFAAVARDIAERFDTGQPVLVATGSVDKSEKLSALLARQGVPHSLLNAKEHGREAAIIAQAGRLGAVTVTTAMAGRGVDVLLGGNPEGLLELELAAYTGDDRDAFAAARLAELEAECAAEGDEVRALGGLYVLGTERLDSRRSNNQVRGRCGRQGDPGETRFYLSLDDELLRVFAKGPLGKFLAAGLGTGDAPLTSRLVLRAVERAQDAVENRNREQRENILKYDEAYDLQRRAVYARRASILDGEDLHDWILDCLDAAVTASVEGHCASSTAAEWDLDGLTADLASMCPYAPVSRDDLARCRTRAAITEAAAGAVHASYAALGARAGDELLRDTERVATLAVIDDEWRHQLVAMNDLRDGITLRATGNIDPVVAWNTDAYTLFGAMNAAIADRVARTVATVAIADTDTATDTDADTTS